MIRRIYIYIYWWLSSSNSKFIQIKNHLIGFQKETLKQLTPSQGRKWLTTLSFEGSFALRYLTQKDKTQNICVSKHRSPCIKLSTWHSLYTRLVRQNKNYAWRETTIYQLTKGRKYKTEVKRKKFQMETKCKLLHKLLTDNTVNRNERD